MTGMKKKLLNRAKALLIKRRFSFTVFKLSFKTSDKIEDISRYWNETNKSFMSGGGGGEGRLRLIIGSISCLQMSGPVTERA